MVLGVQWLRNLGPVTVNFTTMAMEFRYEGKLIQLTAASNMETFGVLQSLEGLPKSECRGFLMQLIEGTQNMDDSAPLSTDLKVVLQEFEDVFQQAHGLPSPRAQDHHIEILLGAGPANKDGSWWFYVDYRALNFITVKDRYPIPVIEELLDELADACYISKLDLRGGYHQIRVEPSDVHKTVFRTHDGHYEFLSHMGETFGASSDGSWTTSAALAEGKGLQLREAYKNEPDTKKMMNDLGVDSNCKQGVLMRDGPLIDKGKIIVPVDRQLCLELMRHFHDSPMAGHEGVLRTYKRLSQSCIWAGMKKDVQVYVKACEVCQRPKTELAKPVGLLQSLPIPIKVWEDVAMDFIDGLPKAKGHSVILVVVDRLSKYAYFSVLAHPYTVKRVAEVYVRNVAKMHYMPKLIVSGRDPIFMSNFGKNSLHSKGLLSG
ncbi:uncharacterized protein [Typha angustifolia]|uniref:uncharacterized protein n=1 Tax=Typha angustifolia TaxID=59011 RepID=UPI003C2AD540